MASKLDRRLTFSAWADGAKKSSFDPLAAAKELAKCKGKAQVFEHGDAITAVEVIGKGSSTAPVRLRLLALHDADNAPSSWGPGAGATQVDFGKDRYSAFFTHVVIWPDKVVAHDDHPNAPGLGRLAEYIRKKTEQRVIFRALYEQGLEEQLKDLKGVRSVEYGIYRPHKLSAATGMFGSLLPNKPNVPAFKVKMGMSRKSKRDAYLPTELADEVVEMADKAEQFFDSLVIRGKSKTQTTEAGNPKTIEVNLLSRRLHVVASLPRDDKNRSAVDAKAAFKAIVAARKQLDQGKKIEDAHEARLLLDQQ